jgi:hypothetical protein
MKRSMKKTLWSIIVVVTSVCAVLGLTIARTIVNKHGSSLAASNQLPVAYSRSSNTQGQGTWSSVSKIAPIEAPDSWSNAKPAH